MTISPEERADLDILKAAIIKAKVEGFDSVSSLAQVSPSTIHHYGHKTVEAAVLSRIKSIKADIEKMICAHERKYPD